MGSVDLDTVVLVSKLGSALLKFVGEAAPLVFQLFG